MPNILAGIFTENSDYKKLEMELENAGIANSDYIVYLSSDHNNLPHLVSVEIYNREIYEAVRHIFSQNHVNKTYQFENMSIKQASYGDLKRLIDARSRAEIHLSPDIKIKTQHDGISSEVKT